MSRPARKEVVVPYDNSLTVEKWTNTIKENETEGWFFMDDHVVHNNDGIFAVMLFQRPLGEKVDQ